MSTGCTSLDKRRKSRRGFGASFLAERVFRLLSWQLAFDLSLHDWHPFKKLDVSLGWCNETGRTFAGMESLLVFLLINAALH